MLNTTAVGVDYILGSEQRVSNVFDVCELNENESTTSTDIKNDILNNEGNSYEYNEENNYETGEESDEENEKTCAISVSSGKHDHLLNSNFIHRHFTIEVKKQNRKTKIQLNIQRTKNSHKKCVVCNKKNVYSHTSNK